jgi:two-component system, OmpR family, KDP operon response regulator KdpE
VLNNIAVKNATSEKKISIKKAAVIDDERDICYLLGNTLRKMSYEVKIATNLKKGLEEVCEMLPEIVFLDINLPDGSGLEFIHVIKSCSPKTKIIIMSAMDGPDEKNKAEREGASVFLSKPFNNKTIALAIAKSNES